MNVMIKKTNIENLKEIQELNNKLFELEYEKFDPSLKVGWPYEREGTEYFSDMLNNETVYIAIVNNTIVGYLAGSINAKYSYVTKSLAEIDNIFILEDYRQYGIGTKLIHKFKEYCLKNEIQEIKVTASAKNDNAIKFYRKNGFENFEMTFKIKLN